MLHAELEYRGRVTDTSVFAVEAKGKKIKIGFITRLELSIDLSGSEIRIWFTEVEINDEKLKASITEARNLAKQCRNVKVMN